MTDLADDPPHVFIVRVWKEARDSGWEWRGSVEHIPTQERVYFYHMEKLVGFIFQKSGAYMTPPQNKLIALFKGLMKFGFGR